MNRYIYLASSYLNGERLFIVSHCRYVDKMSKKKKDEVHSVNRHAMRYYLRESSRVVISQSIFVLVYMMYGLLGTSRRY